MTSVLRPGTRRREVPEGGPRTTSFWLRALERRATRDENVDFTDPIVWSSEAERRAAVKFFNAALRAEESGLRQAHELADDVASFDPELAEVLRLYGNEEGWHKRLLEGFLERIGGSVQPMGPVTRIFYSAYARAKRMETIVLTNLMFETIGATTYRMALKNVRHQSARRMLTVLAKDESFHVPLNVHFLREVVQRDPSARKRLVRIHALLFSSLLLLPFASRPKARAFDGIARLELVRAYARALGGLFVREPELGLSPPRWASLLFGRTPVLPDAL
jgi:hypothetical protein